MSKTCTDLVRHTLNGPTMGTRWSALFFTTPQFDTRPVHAALQKAVDEVDAQMSTWKPGSDLMRLNRGPVDTWIIVPDELFHVLALGLEIGRASGGNFDIGMGDAVEAWGFGVGAADSARIRDARGATRRPAHETLELVGNRVRKHAEITLDLNGIAKGHGVDRLAQVLGRFGIEAGLVSIDGEMRAAGLRPDGQGWTIAIEAPDPDCRAPHSVLSLQDGAIATSGDYRHGVVVQGQCLSHTMDPRRGAPLASSPASVSVLAATCAEADAWATVFMVAGPDAGISLAHQQGLGALFLLRDDAGRIRSRACGLFH